MSNDAEAREVHATVTDPEESREPVNDDLAEPDERLGIDAEDDEMIDPDAVIIAEHAGEPNDLDDLDEAEDGTHPDTVVAEAVVVEPVPADDTAAEPVPADDIAAEPVPTDGTAEPVAPETTTAEPVPAETTTAEPVPAFVPGGPKHAAADSGPARPGMPVNGDVTSHGPMVGDPERLHERWAAIQSTFVDDPRGSVTSAADMVTEVIATVVASAKDRESGLRGEWDRDGVDTEGLRNALRSYRALLDQLAAL